MLPQEDKEQAKNRLEGRAHWARSASHLGEDAKEAGGYRNPDSGERLCPKQNGGPATKRMEFKTWERLRAPGVGGIERDPRSCPGKGQLQKTTEAKTRINQPERWKVVPASQW